VITSPHNKRVTAAARLKKRALREKDRRFLVEGVQAVAEAFSSGADVREVFATPESEERLDRVISLAKQAGAPVHTVSPEVMGHLTSTVTPQGVVAVAGFVDVPLTAVVDGAGGIVPVLVEVRDPGNAGTILRSADASGSDAVVFTRSSVDVYNPKTVRATAGSLFHVPVVRDVELAEAVDRLRERGFAVMAATASGDEVVQDVDLSGPTAVLFGNEARGLTPEALGLADRSVRVPIQGRAESLNLAAAATLVLFEAARQRSVGRRPVAFPGSGMLARIVAGAAHDIRSPLTALKGFSMTLLSRWDRLTDAERRLMLEGMTHDAQRMEVVLSQVVDAAKLASGTLELTRVPTNLLEMATKVRADATAWEQADVEVSGRPVTAVVDPARLRTMLLAMIESAQWFGDRGPVTMEVEDRPHPTVRVWRQGTAVSPQDADRLFVPRTPGTGAGSKIGLFVAQRLAEAHGGSLVAQVGDRLELTLTLPGESA
jgi:RNA methyltransferase, TrmH family